MRALLRASNVRAGYGDIEVLRGIDLVVNEGEIVALLGPNGAGKTTFLRVIAGLLRPNAGTVEFAGSPLDRIAAHLVVRRGIAMVPEGKQLWPQMTVDEHLRVGATSRRLQAAEQKRQRELVFSLFPVLGNRRHSLASTFSGGEQQMLAIARALMSQPRLLLLDEPSLGLAPMVTASVFNAISTIRGEGVSVLLVEQNVRQALHRADRGYMMDRGSIFKEGAASELASVGKADLADLAL
jgi:branched-chain amino acid transport system ATP-binding protein